MRTFVTKLAKIIEDAHSTGTMQVKVNGYHVHVDDCLMGGRTLFIWKQDCNMEIKLYEDEFDLLSRAITKRYEQDVETFCNLEGPFWEHGEEFADEMDS